MKLIDRQYLATPFYGARKIAAWLKKQEYGVDRTSSTQIRAPSSPVRPSPGSCSNTE